MRVLIVSQYFHPEVFRINQLAALLKTGGHEVVVLTAQPNYPSGRFFPGYSAFGPTKEVYEGVEVLRVPIFPRGRGRSWELVLNYLSFVFFAIVFGIPRLRGRFDVCVAWCSSPITIAVPAIVYRFLTRTPVAIWVQDLWPETFFAVTKKKNAQLSRALSTLVRWIYKNVDQIWIQSQAYVPSVKAHGGREDQIEFVPNWAENLYDRARWQAVEKDHLPPNSLLFAGNLGRAQGLETIIEVIELLKKDKLEVNWVLLGEGTLKPWLTEEVSRRGLSDRVHFLPRRPPSEMPKALSAATGVLVTLGHDPVYAMTIPSKVQSCLAAGRPILAALAGEPARVVQEAGAGLVAAPENAQEFAKVVKDFFALPEKERSEMGARGHRYYSAHFTQDKVVTRIVELLEKMGHQ